MVFVPFEFVLIKSHLIVDKSLPLSAFFNRSEIAAFSASICLIRFSRYGSILPFFANVVDVESYTL